MPCLMVSCAKGLKSGSYKSLDAYIKLLTASGWLLFECINSGILKK